jgi:hypothetical protein
MPPISLKDLPGRCCRQCKKILRPTAFPKMVHQIGRSPICGTCIKRDVAAANYALSRQLVADRKVRQSLQ